MAASYQDFTQFSLPQFGGPQPKPQPNTLVTDPTTQSMPASAQVPPSLNFPGMGSTGLNTPSFPKPSTTPQAATPPPATTPPPASTTAPGMGLNLPSWITNSPYFHGGGLPGVSSSTPTTQPVNQPGPTGTTPPPATSYPADLKAALYGAFGGPGNIFETVNAAPQSSQLQSYVDQASQGLKSAYQQDLANQLIDLQSRYASEGSYLASPMFAAEGQLRANLGSNYLNSLGQLQLGAAEAERGRQYGAATQQSQNALQMAQMFQQLASQAQASGASLQAAQYSAMANIFGSQAGMYSSQLNNQTNQQGNILQYLLGQGNLGLQGQQQQWMQQFQQEQANQAARQNALNLLGQSYYQPGQNAFQFLAPFAGLPTTSKTTGGGIGDILGGIASGLAGNSGFTSGLLGLL